MDERPASLAAARPLSLSIEPSIIPPPPFEVHPEQVIEDNPKLVVIAAESDMSVEQMDNPDSVLDCQKE